MTGGCARVAGASPEFEAWESGFDGKLPERWERELRGREASAGILCLFLVNTGTEISTPKVQKPQKKKHSLSFHVASQQVRALERFPTIFDTALEERLDVMIRFMTSACHNHD